MQTEPTISVQEEYDLLNLTPKRVTAFLGAVLERKGVSPDERAIMANDAVQTFAANQEELQPLLTDPETSLYRFSQSQLLPARLNEWVAQHGSMSAPDSNTNILRRRLSKLQIGDLKHLKLEKADQHRLATSILIFSLIQRNQQAEPRKGFSATDLGQRADAQTMQDARPE